MPARKPRKPRVRFSPEVAARILAALNAGHGLRRLARQPGLPTRATIMRWLKAHPDFADQVWVARFDGGLGVGGPGRPTRYSPRLHTRIYDRLSAGVPLRTICASPAMPSRSTVYNWARAHPRFARALDLARENALSAEADARLEALGFHNYYDLARAPLPDVRGPGRPRKPKPPPP
jgi:transposase-like protein